MTEAKLVARGLTKSFELGGERVEVLAGIDLELAAGDAAAIMGPSGSGKSTLLHILGTLDRPSGGTLAIDGRDPFALAEADLARFRNQRVGFVFQDHHLLPQYTVLENVLLPALAFRPAREGVEDWGRELLARVGLGHRLKHRPGELSGGERQRVAVARSLIQRPSLLLCDEPTGNLDRRNAAAIADLLFDLHRERDGAMIVVTHAASVAERFERRFELRDGTCFEA